MDRRTVFAVLLAGVLLPAGAAAAAPTQRPRSAARVCNLLTDARSDATAGPMSVTNNPSGSEPAYDIVSADIATNHDTVTAVIRVVGLAKSTPSSPTGIHWRLDFTVLGSPTRLFLQAFSSPFGDNFDVGYVDGTTSNSYSGVDVTGVFDTSRNEVRISAPLSAMKDEVIIASGSTIEGLHAAAGRFYNTAGTHPSVSERTDEATSTRTYTAGTASCVAVGK